ncbi:MAG: HD-GYP domain-containing protein [Terriglobia bacterium]
MVGVRPLSTQLSHNRKRKVLIVDDEPSFVKILTEILRPAGYICIGCQSGEEALRLMDIYGFDALLCDIYMPGISGLEVLRFVKEQLPRMAFLMVTGESDVQVGVQAMKVGADDYLLKPLNPATVLVSVSQALEKKKIQAESEDHRLQLERLVEEGSGQLSSAMGRLEQNYGETLQVLAAALDLRDSGTAGHSGRVMAYTMEIAKLMGCGREQLNTIARGALLHDIGKIGVPDSILMKPGPLRDEEWPMMKAHVGIGYSLLKRIAFLGDAAEMVLAHHERFDGQGYPQGLHGPKIHLGARIFAVADTLDAMTSDRPYRWALPFAAAHEEIVWESGKQFDPEVVSAFLAIEEGTWHELRAPKESVKSSRVEQRLLVPPDHGARALLPLLARV